MKNTIVTTYSRYIWFRSLKNNTFTITLWKSSFFSFLCNLALQNVGWHAPEKSCSRPAVVPVAIPTSFDKRRERAHTAPTRPPSALPLFSHASPPSWAVLCAWAARLLPFHLRQSSTPPPVAVASFLFPLRRPLPPDPSPLHRRAGRSRRAATAARGCRGRGAAPRRSARRAAGRCTPSRSSPPTGASTTVPASGATTARARSRYLSPLPPPFPFLPPLLTPSILGDLLDQSPAKWKSRCSISHCLPWLLWFGLLLLRAYLVLEMLSLPRIVWLMLQFMYFLVWFCHPDQSRSLVAWQCPLRLRTACARN
jgi:hypothetical protein